MDYESYRDFWRFRLRHKPIAWLGPFYYLLALIAAPFIFLIILALEGLASAILDVLDMLSGVALDSTMYYGLPRQKFEKFMADFDGDLIYQLYDDRIEGYALSDRVEVASYVHQLDSIKWVRNTRKAFYIGLVDNTMIALPQRHIDDRLFGELDAYFRSRLSKRYKGSRGRRASSAA